MFIIGDWTAHSRILTWHLRSYSSSLLLNVLNAWRSYVRWIDLGPPGPTSPRTHFWGRI